MAKIIVKLLETDEQISAMYDTWHSYKCGIVRTYTDEVPDKIPIDDNEEFKSIRNAVVKSAARFPLRPRNRSEKSITIMPS